jgi:hypothetical protein
MNTKQIKSTIAVCGFLAAMSAPLTTEADTTVFSGKDAYGEMWGSMWGSDGNWYTDVWTLQSASQSKSDKTNSSGAYFWGTYYSYSGTSCWYGFGFTDAIEFAATGKTPSNVSNVTASGSVSVTWDDWCGGADPITENVTFNLNLSAITDQTYSSFGSDHYEYGATKVNSHYDIVSAPATSNDSVITSPSFGAITPINSVVGTSKGHSVTITK